MHVYIIHYIHYTCTAYLLFDKEIKIPVDSQNQQRSHFLQLLQTEVDL